MDVSFSIFGFLFRYWEISIERLSAEGIRQSRHKNRYAQNKHMYNAAKQNFQQMYMIYIFSNSWIKIIK